MAANLNKFLDLPFLQKRKKVCYYIHRSLSEKTEIYLDDIKSMIYIINQTEYRKITYVPSLEGIKTLYNILYQQIIENDPYQESVLFDSISPQRTLLPTPIKIVLENLRSPFNIGAFFRMSEAFGIHQILLLGNTPSPIKQKKIIKTAKGDLISFSSFSSIEELIKSEQQDYKHITFYAIEKAKGSVNLNTLNSNLFFSEDCHYFIFGNEEFGINPQTLKYCKNIYHISMFGTKNSLNVSVAGGIVLHHIASVLLP